MIRMLNVVAVLFLVALSVVIYNVQYRFEQQENRVANLHKEISREEDAIRVLRAEWSHLTQPGRLQALAERHLALRPLSATQVVDFDDLPMPPVQKDLYGPNGRRALGGFAGMLSGAPGFSSEVR